MVSTRRNGAKTAAASNLMPRAPKRRKNNNATNAGKLPEPTPVRSSITQNPSLSATGTALSKSKSELGDLTLISPPTDRTTTEDSALKMSSSSLPGEVKPSTEQVMVALKKLVTPGSSHNPIIVIEDSPTSKMQTKTARHRKSSPQRFQDRHSKLYTYKPPLSALAPKPANGSTFTGHEDHNIYRMFTAKMAQPSWHLNRNQYDHQDAPFEVQYPISTHHLVPQQGITYPPLRPSVQYYAPHAPTHLQHTGSPPLDEKQLRRKAIQYVREYSRPLTRKKRMAEDPDETSESESEEVNRYTTPFPRRNELVTVLSGTVKPHGGAFTILPDPQFHLTPLIEHASLLTSLLRIYTQSADQKGLREDITMLASVQNQHLTDWLNLEVYQSRKQTAPHAPRANRITTASPAKPVTPYLTEQQRAEVEKRRIQDAEIRNLLSADAKLWQEGSGLSVADVYADTRASTPPNVQQEDGSECRSAVISASSPVRSTVKIPCSTPRSPRVTASPMVKSRSCKVPTTSRDVATIVSSPVVLAYARKSVTPSRKVARKASPSKIRPSGRKRTALASLNMEQPYRVGKHCEERSVPSFNTTIAL